MKHKFYLTASLKEVQASDDLKKEVAAVIELPSGDSKQPDLSYFSAILVSSGENLNHACFLPSELVAAADTVVSKALDIEHNESEIIGHLYASCFTDKVGNKLDLTELAATDAAALDSKDMHIQIGAIVYKARFPEIAKEIADDEWKVSMECYYSAFDIMVGKIVIPSTYAQLIGYNINDDSIFGKSGKIIRDGKEIANGTITRVLRGICFSGCGIVKNPANPASLILETASTDEIVFNLDKIECKTLTSGVENDLINVTSSIVDTTKNDNVITKIQDDVKITTQSVCKDEIIEVAKSCIDKLFNKKCVAAETADSLSHLQNVLQKTTKSLNEKFRRTN